MPSPYDPVENVAYTLEPTGGLSGNKKYLSTRGDGSLVDLWSQVDPQAPKRQHWLFVRRPEKGDNIYEIHVAGNVTPKAKNFLSCNGSGKTVDLWTSEDGSGRQLWKLARSDEGWFTIEVFGGVGGSRKFLSCRDDGGLVDLWDSEDGSGRQQWLLVPEDLELIKLEMDQTRTGSIATPGYIDHVTLFNPGDTTQSMTAHFTKRAQETSNFQQEYGIGIKYGEETKVKVGVAEESISFEVSMSAKWTYGKSQTEEDSRTYDFPIVVPPKTKMVATVMVATTKADVPYVATGRSATTGQEVKIRGTWKGVLLGDVSVEYKPVPLTEPA